MSVFLRLPEGLDVILLCGEAGRSFNYLIALKFRVSSYCMQRNVLLLFFFSVVFSAGLRLSKRFVSAPLAAFSLGWSRGNGQGQNKHATFLKKKVFPLPSQLPHCQAFHKIAGVCMSSSIVFPLP